MSVNSSPAKNGQPQIRPQVLIPKSLDIDGCTKVVIEASEKSVVISILKSQNPESKSVPERNGLKTPKRFKKKSGEYYVGKFLALDNIQHPESADEPQETPSMICGFTFIVLIPLLMATSLRCTIKLIGSFMQDEATRTYLNEHSPVDLLSVPRLYKTAFLAYVAAWLIFIPLVYRPFVRRLFPVNAILGTLMPLAIAFSCGVFGFYNNCQHLETIVIMMATLFSNYVAFCIIWPFDPPSVGLRKFIGTPITATVQILFSSLLLYLAYLVLPIWFGVQMYFVICHFVLAFGARFEKYKRSPDRRLLFAIRQMNVVAVLLQTYIDLVTLFLMLYMLISFVVQAVL